MVNIQKTLSIGIHDVHRLKQRRELRDFLFILIYFMELFLVIALKAILPRKGCERIPLDDVLGRVDCIFKIEVIFMAVRMCAFGWGLTRFEANFIHVIAEGELLPFVPKFL